METKLRAPDQTEMLFVFLLKVVELKWSEDGQVVELLETKLQEVEEGLQL